MEQAELLTLIEKCKQGDQAAQEKLVVETQNKVYYHCKKFLKNEEDAQDATQDVLVTMLTSLDKLREPAAFWGWLNGITANRCKHMLTQGTKEWQIPEDEEGNSLLDSMETLDDQTVPDKVIDTAETQRLILDIIDGLPAEQRMTVTFFYYDEMSVKAIAEMMEVSEGTVKSRLNYARKSIKEGVEELEKKGTKLYGVSPLPFLAYFLRQSMAAESLSPAMAGTMAQGVLATAGTAAGATAGTAAGTAAATGTATATTATAGTATATAAAAGTKVAGAVATKIIAAALAGTLTVGGIGAGVYVATHQEPEATPTPAVPAVVITTPTPKPTDPPIPAICGQVYGPKVLELSQALGDGAMYGLAYINEDDIPELTASHGSDYGEWRFISVYSISPEGELCDTGEFASGLRSDVCYYPGANIVKDSGVSSPTTGETVASYSRMNDSGQLEEFFSSTGEALEELAPPPEVEGLQSAGLEGSLTAQEMLDLLGYAPSTPEPSEEPTSTPANEDFVIENGVLVKYNGPGGDVTVPDGVTAIGTGAFAKARATLTGVTLPEGLTSIGTSAFLGCVKLTNISLPSSLTSIGDAALYSCTALTGIALPDGLTTIGDMAFLDCGLTSITIPNSVTSIGERAFAYTALTGIVIPDSVTTMGSGTFCRCQNLSQVTIGKGLTRIESTTFYDCPSLTEITIPENITYIGSNVFHDGTINLAKVTILNPAVDLYATFYRPSESNPNLTLYAPAGSTTETYAQQNNIPFVALDN